MESTDPSSTNLTHTESTLINGLTRMTILYCICFTLTPSPRHPVPLPHNTPGNYIFESLFEHFSLITVCVNKCFLRFSPFTDRTIYHHQSSSKYNSVNWRAKRSEKRKKLVAGSHKTSRPRIHGIDDDSRGRRFLLSVLGL